MEKLTKENYKTNHDYMSYSRVSRYMECEAATAAGWHKPTTISQLVGSYVDAYFSGEMEEFKQEHPEILNSRTGELKSDFKQADSIIERIKSDETFMDYLNGEKQAIMTGEIDGVPFKIKMDVYVKDKRICDLKVLKDFTKVWSNAYNSTTNFVLAYNYDIEMAIFQEIVRQNTGVKLPCYLLCITKEEPADIGIFELPQSTLDSALVLVKKWLARIKKIESGQEKPYRCEKCGYCRSTKKAQVYDFELIGASGDKLREEGYECVDDYKKKEVCIENKEE